MKKSMFRGIIGMTFLFTILLFSCTNTRLVSSWGAPNAKVDKSKKVLVIGLMGPRDRKLREQVENIMVANLKERGVDAGSAFAEFGPKAFDGLDEQATLNKIRTSGYDEAFTVALLDKRKQKRYNPGYVGFAPYTYRFWGYYRTVYGRIYEPGYYSVNTNFMLEANYYNLTNDQLVYSVQTKSVDPASPQSLASEFSKALLDDMAKKGILNR